MKCPNHSALDNWSIETNYVGVANEQSIKVHTRKRPIRSELDQGSIETIHVRTVCEQHVRYHRRQIERVLKQSTQKKHLQSVGKEYET